MFLQILRLEGTSQIKLDGFKIYDIFNVEISIPNTAKATQSSDLKETIGNPLDQSFVTYNANYPLEGKPTKTTPFEKGWWEVDLGVLMELGKIKISRTNVGRIICMNSDRKELFSETRDGFFNFENPPDYVVNLPHTYYLSAPILTSCVNGSVYEYQSCKSSDEVSCPSKYVPRLKSPIHDLIIKGPGASDDSKKWGVLSKKDCGEIVDPKDGSKYNLKNPSLWSDCNNGQKVRQWNECINDRKDCPLKMPFKEVQTCENGELVWGPWGGCVNDPNDPVKGVKTRKSTCSPPVNGGEPCPDIPHIQTQECTNHQLSNWSEWSKCQPQSDGTMGISRSRKCIDGTNGGTTCAELAKNEPLTITHPCSDAKLTEWSDWSKCKNSLQTRTRQCILPANGGQECDPKADLLDTQGCSDGYLKPWSQWSKCNGSYQTRERECVAPTGAGQPCDIKEPLNDIKPCQNVWSDCNLLFYQTNENDDHRVCSPNNTFAIIFALIIVLIIIIHILYRI
jgi:hypothetical protein